MPEQQDNGLNPQKHEKSGLAFLDVAQARPTPQPGRYFLSALGVLLIVSLVFALISNPRFEWNIVFAWLGTQQVIAGVLMTLLLTAVCMLLGVAFGAILALVRLSDNRVLSYMANAYVWFFRAIPQLVQILFWFNLAALFPRVTIPIPGLKDYFTWETNDLITPLSAAILALTLIEAAYMAEVIRGGLLSIEQGQYEASKALGMGPVRTMIRVIAPQTMRVIIPPMGSNAIRMVKGTALVSVIGLSDLLYSVQAVYSQTYQVIPLLVVACIWYLIINTILYLFQSMGEKFFNKGRKRGGKKSAPKRRTTVTVTEGEL